MLGESSLLLPLVTDVEELHTCSIRQVAKFARVWVSGRELEEGEPLV
jgi:hypothetical protein